MTDTPSPHRRRFKKLGFVSLGAAILASAAIWLFLPDRPEPGEPHDFEVAVPGDGKGYLRSMELYGGKANVMAAEIRLFLGGLLTGRALAGTVLAAGLALSLGCFVLAGFEPDRSRQSGADKDQPPGPP